MSNAQLVAISGLAGIGLSGGFQIALAAWKDWKDRRAALRPVESELSGIVSVLSAIPRDTVHFLLGKSALPGMTAWATYESRLARELPRRKWIRVEAGYNLYAAVLAVGRAGAARDETEGTVAPGTAESLTDAAIVGLRRAHRAVAGRRGHRAAERVWSDVRGSLE